MTVKVAPEMWFLQGPATDVEANKLRTSAAAFRRMVDGLQSARQGVVFSRGTCQDLKVNATGTPDGFVHVVTGACYVRGTQAADQGMYHVYNDAQLDINVLGPNPAHATLDRIDLVVARVQDQFYSGSTDTMTIEMVTGTPAGSPVAPTPPANTLILAQLSIVHASSTIPQSVITDRRIAAGNGPVVLDDIVVGVDSRYNAATAQIDFLNSSGVGTNLLPPGWSVLEIVGQLRGTNAATSVEGLLRLNNDSSNTYSYERLAGLGNAAANGGESGASAQSAMRDWFFTGSTALSAASSGIRILLPNPALGTLNKQALVQEALYAGSAAFPSASQQQTATVHCYWRNSAIITRLSILAAAGNIDVGSRLTLIGHVGVQP